MTGQNWMDWAQNLCIIMLGIAGLIDGKAIREHKGRLNAVEDWWRDEIRGR